MRVWSSQPCYDAITSHRLRSTGRSVGGKTARARCTFREIGPYPPAQAPESPYFPRLEAEVARCGETPFPPDSNACAVTRAHKFRKKRNDVQAKTYIYKYTFLNPV
jgi:hypothetical protein